MSRELGLPEPDASMSRGTAMRAARRVTEPETAAEAEDRREEAAGRQRGSPLYLG